MNKKIISILLFSLLSGILYSQNKYIQYHQLIVKVKNLQKKKQKDSLCFYLQEAFSLVDYVHIDNLKLAKRIAKQQQHKKLLDYCENALKQSKSSINYKLKSQLDSISKEDKRVRSRKFLKAKRYYFHCLKDSTFIYDEKKRLNAKKLMSEWWKVDSCNVEFVKKIIAKHGYPSEKLVGKEGNNQVGIILLHYDKDTANHIMENQLTIALNKGKIIPRMYAWIIDRHLMWVGKDQKYYSIPTPWKKMPLEKRNQYNKNRKLIGLKPIEEIKMIVRKNSVVIRN